MTRGVPAKMTVDASAPRMSIAEFREEGFLQEANRQFFHPLGLALEVAENDDGTWRLSSVWDYRDDPEGMVFWIEGGEAERTFALKAKRVRRERGRHRVARVALFGSPIQTIERTDDER